MRTHAVILALILTIVPAFAGDRVPGSWSGEEGVWSLHPWARSGSQFRIGAGEVAGMHDGQAVWLAGKSRNGNFRSAMTQTIPVIGWGGKRLRVSLRLKNEGDVRGNVDVALSQSDRTAILYGTSQQNGAGDGWQTHVFVLNVPYDAVMLSLNVGLTGDGKVWADDINLEAAGADEALTPWRRTDRDPSTF